MERPAARALDSPLANQPQLLRRTFDTRLRDAVRQPFWQTQAASSPGELQAEELRRRRWALEPSVEPPRLPGYQRQRLNDQPDAGASKAFKERPVRLGRVATRLWPGPKEATRGSGRPT